MGFNFRRPTPKDMGAYIERLVDKYKSPSTIRNNISAVRTYMASRGWSTKVLDTVRVQNALRAVDIQMRHVPAQRRPISPAQLLPVIGHLSSRRHGSMMVLAVILMFQAFLRQSNLFPSTVAGFDPTRQMTVGDIMANGTNITLAIKWSKTQQKFGDHQSITLHALPSSPLCPMAAYNKAARVRRTNAPNSPLITFVDGNSITTGFMKKEWNQALAAVSLPPAHYSLHSLRRGGATFSYFQGGDTLYDVQRHGGWRSDSIRAYLKPPSTFKDSVHRALETL